MVEEDDDEDGHTVVATARGVFNSNGGVLSSIETGVSIIIPQGAIPEGVEQEIYFKVCRDNSILPPLDKEKGNRVRVSFVFVIWAAWELVGLHREDHPDPVSASLLVTQSPGGGVPSGGMGTRWGPPQEARGRGGGELAGPFPQHALLPV